MGISMDVLALDKFTSIYSKIIFFLRNSATFCKLQNRNPIALKCRNEFDGLISSIVNFDSKCRV
jgi:hypothetical protein